MPTTLGGGARAHLFDDASLFPPARSPWPRRCRAPRACAGGRWLPMVGPFLCPASRLDELEACLASGLPRPPELGVIGYGGRPLGGHLRHAGDRAGRGAPVGAATRPPRGVSCATSRSPPTPVPRSMAAVLDEVAGTAARAKVRCGGLTPEDVPPCDWLAAALAAVSNGGSSLKATAGLHHPFRSTGPDGPRHGFVNLLAAAGAAHAGADAAR